jgi:hypothetical protein
MGDLPMTPEIREALTRSVRRTRRSLPASLHRIAAADSESDAS